MGLLDVFDSSDSDAQKYLQQALAAYRDINVPTDESMRIGELPLQTVQGTVNPEAIQVAEQGPTDYTNISLDPATRAAQMEALSGFTNIAGEGGLDASAKLSIQEALDEAKRQSQAEQGAIMRSAQAMGQGGGDFALTQRAIAAQGASNAASEAGMRAAAEAEANREQALANMANLGGSINAADFAKAAEKARAQDVINVGNIGARNAANTNDVSNKIQTGEFNVGTAQNVNAANTAANQGKLYYNASLPQQRFQNELAKAGGVAGVSGAQANTAQNAQNADTAFWGNLLGTGATVAATALGGPAAGAATKMATSGGGTPVGTAPGIGTITTPKNPNQYRPIGYDKGGYTCYADGGVTHDHAICMKLGGHVPGEAEVDGDSPENDTVPAMLSPGELVIPRSVPKTGPAMEEFARNAPVGGTDRKLDLTSFTNGYKRSR